VTSLNHTGADEPQRKGKSNRLTSETVETTLRKDRPLKSSKGCVRLGIRSGRRNFLSCNRSPRILNSLHVDLLRLPLNESRNFLRFEGTDYTLKRKKENSGLTVRLKRKLLHSGVCTSIRRRIVTKRYGRYLSEYF
jgi:hypothetical protein